MRLEAFELVPVAGFFGESEGISSDHGVLWQPSPPVVKMWSERFSPPAGYVVFTTYPNVRALCLSHTPRICVIKQHFGPGKDVSIVTQETLALHFPEFDG